MSWLYKRNSSGIVILIAALVILFIPFLAIWSVNTLFNTEIPYNAETWIASLVLGNIVSYNPPRR